MDKKLLFALDIGTHSLVGIVGEKKGNEINIIATERLEHHTRAMLDGQIHDVPEVAAMIGKLKEKLEKTCGTLTKVSVAAAGRALLTLETSAKTDFVTKKILNLQDEQSLELTALQNAQKSLANSHTIVDPTAYYCVGYSVSKYCLDGTELKSLVGQRGKEASLELIATFLPRQVIDSIQTALKSVDLEIDTLTLEPIAAINILIPPTMRHLNLALVDIGAGTSDVAITKNGSVTGYGMVPIAGDEITEALSQSYLLDFKVAELAKQKLTGRAKKIDVTDVLGTKHKISSQEMIEHISEKVGELAQSIASEIVKINAMPPQAVLMVGGGALTPKLTEAVAQALDVPSTRVAIREPDKKIDGFTNIPTKLCTPDSVTPLGILKLAGSQALNFVSVSVNSQPLKLFNIGSLSVADALLSAGIDIKSLHGKPGLGITITINGNKQFIPGTYGRPGEIKINGESANFDTVLHEGDSITVHQGADGQSPSLKLVDLIDIPSPLKIYLDAQEYLLPPIIKINGKTAASDVVLNDRDQIEIQTAFTLKGALQILDLMPETVHYSYTVNDIERLYSAVPVITLNETEADLNGQLHSNDRISVKQIDLPTVGELLGLSAADFSSISVTFNNTACSIPTRSYQINLNGQPANLTDLAPHNSIITCTCREKNHPMVSDVLLAAKFDPHSIPTNARYELLLNGTPAEYTAIVKNNDSVELSIETSVPRKQAF